MDPQQDSTSKTGAWRFSLRGLLVLTAAVAAPLALCRRNWVAGTLLAVLFVGVALIVFGIRQRRKSVTTLGMCLAIFAATLVGLSMFSKLVWVGSQQLEVNVLVLDASTLKPVSAATVEVLRGPASPLETAPGFTSSDFRRDQPEGGPRELATDAQGRVTFAYDFFAAGQESVWGNSGYVNTGITWVRVTTVGYNTTYMPLDRQSLGTRDIDDKQPLHVTVPIGKQ